MRLLLSLLLAARICLEAVPVVADTAADLQAAAKLYRYGELERARRELEKLARKPIEPKELGQVQLYLGVISTLTGAAAKGEELFAKALRADPTLRLDPEQFKAELIQRFETVRGRLRGELKVSANLEGAVVFVDSKREGVAPISLKLPPGIHQVEVHRAGGGDRFQARAIVPVGGVVSLRAELQAPLPATAPALPPPTEPARASRPRRIWTWVTAGVAVGAGAAALGLGLSAKSAFDEFETLDLELAKTNPTANPTRVKEINSRMDGLQGPIQDRALGANVCIGLAGALAATAVVLFFVEGRESTKRFEPRAALAPGGFRLEF